MGMCVCGCSERCISGIRFTWKVMLAKLWSSFKSMRRSFSIVACQVSYEGSRVGVGDPGGGRLERIIISWTALLSPICMWMCFQYNYSTVPRHSFVGDGNIHGSLVKFIQVGLSFLGGVSTFQVSVLCLCLRF